MCACVERKKEGREDRKERTAMNHTIELLQDDQQVVDLAEKMDHRQRSIIALLHAPRETERERAARQARDWKGVDGTCDRTTSKVPLLLTWIMKARAWMIFSGSMEYGELKQSCSAR